MTRQPTTHHEGHSRAPFQHLAPRKFVLAFDPFLRLRVGVKFRSVCGQLVRKIEETRVSRNEEAEAAAVEL